MMNLYWCHGVMLQLMRLNWISYSLLHTTHIAHRSYEMAKAPIKPIDHAKGDTKYTHSKQHHIRKTNKKYETKIQMNEFENKRDTNEWRILAWIHFTTKRQQEKSPMNNEYTQKKHSLTNSKRKLSYKMIWNKKLSIVNQVRVG